MEPKLLLPGVEDEQVKQEIGAAEMRSYVKVKVKTARVVDLVARSAGDAAYTPLPDDVADDDIVELDFENGERGWRQWMTVDQLRALREQRVSRDGTADGAQAFIPHTWAAKDASRGLGTITLKALKIFGIDPQSKLAEKVGRSVTAAVAEHFEGKLEKQGHPFGLYRFVNPAEITAKDQISDAKKLTGSGPYLIFIHGTASSSTGSFGGLAGTSEWQRLQQEYGERVLALEHRTFSVSPIRNALDLVKLLPDGARLHLVSHSRGGLVGELICLAQAGDCRAKFDELTQAFAQPDGDDSLKAERERQREELKELWDALLQKKLEVERFVRVACPAYGTTLASKRMDYLASGLLNAIGFIPGIEGNPFAEAGYDWLKSLLLTLVKKKADPRELPGIEAMIPDSPLIEFLNHQALVTKADLGVIAGDIEVGNLKLTVPALIGNAFFWGKNDLVVNTKAMYDGIRRQEKKAYFFFTQGKTVCHFNYFVNEETRARLRDWLLRPNDKLAENFREVQRDESRSRDGQTISAWLEKEEPLAVAGPVYTLPVSVAHGDLRHARHLVAVGHYDGDGIVSAERYIDRWLDGRLSDRLGMRLYPGPVGTAAVVYGPPDSAPQGALVIGLGEMGEINVEAVKQGVMTAALRHALTIAEQLDTPRNGKNTARGGKDAMRNGKAVSRDSKSYASAAFSSLLIGTYGGNALRVEESVAAIIQGTLAANRILHLQGLWDRVRIDEIELIELYENVAIRALHAVHDLSSDQLSDFAREVTLKPAPATLRTVGGGRYHRPTEELETYWYGRIQISGVRNNGTSGAAAAAPLLPKIFSLDPDRQITQRHFINKLIEEAIKTPAKQAQLAEVIVELLTQDRAQADNSGALEFLVLTDRARLEASLQATQRQLVDYMVEQSVNKVRYDKDLSISLFDLLIPNELKNRAENVILMLDRVSAQYPWELMTDRNRASEPLATRMGIVRQFRTADFRANPRPARVNHALVIGDTANSGLIELPGAQEEARAVAKLLRGEADDAGTSSQALYQVWERIKADGKLVINELFAREYQILHIAAHGDYNPQQPDRSGVVLSGGRFLTAKELVNLRTVPDLVFINCCHLGKVEREENCRLKTEFPHRLAASVAEELIKMGVKAVVAAGWAVHDGAAKTFAQTFYKNMLSGEAFGQAVLEARRATYEEFAELNTWGAYQCYGNPNFRLNLQGGGTSREVGFYSRREYRDELRGIAARPDWQNERGNQWSRDRLVRLEKELQGKTATLKLLDDGEVLTDFGEAWFALGNFEEALAFYERAIHAKDAGSSLRAIERLANLECRYAVQLWERANEQKSQVATKTRGKTNDRSAQRKRAQTLLARAKKRFDWLLSLEKTSERYALVGKAHKCLAVVAETAAQRQTRLKQAHEFYERSCALALAANEPLQKWLYPLVNVIACGWLLPGRKKEDLLALIAEGKEKTVAAPEFEEDFWVRVNEPELELLEGLVRGDLVKRQDAIIAAYREAFARRVKPSDIESVLGQMQLLITMLKSGRPTPQETRLIKALSAIKSTLSQPPD